MSVAFYVSLKSEPLPHMHILVVGLEFIISCYNCCNQISMPIFLKFTNECYVLARPSEPLRLVRFRPHHFFAEVGVVLFARALIITLLFSLGKMASMLDSKGEL